MYTIKDRLEKELEEIKSSGLYKNERVITSEQGAEITVGGKTVLNFVRTIISDLAHIQK